MNFNPMDLIKIKEFFYKRDDKFDVITEFISLLIDLQCQGATLNNTPIGKELGKDFFLKQILIELGYTMNKLDFDFLKTKRGNK